MKKFVFLTSPTEALIFTGSDDEIDTVIQLEKPTEKQERKANKLSPPVNLHKCFSCLFISLHKFSFNYKHYSIKSFRS